MTRSEVYAWLAAKLGLPRAVTHIGMFDEATCIRALQIRNQIND